ncbi:Fe-S cluster assembly protein SufD [Proteobacteria bacterium 005FR1]|nr:Fe-S cluster assembly protein SufD [Proteobacteria bacterium 005FR1]
MSEWLQSAIARAETMDDWLAPQRRESLALLREAPWPSRKVEAWRYTPLTALERADLSTAVVDTTAPDAQQIAGVDSIDLVIRNGRFENPMKELPAGLRITSLQSADDGARERVKDLFGTVKPTRHIFGLVNDVLASDGLLIEIDAAAVIEKPLRIVHLVSKGADVHTRVLVSVGEGAQAAVIEQVQGEHASFNTSFAEYAIGSGAKLEHYRFALQTGEAMGVGGSHFKLDDRAELNSTIVGFGSNLSRLDTDIIHDGENAQAKLNAIYLLQQNELFDLHATVEHAVPHGTTEENVRGIVADQARAVFNGRIHIHRHAQKTVAELNNRNLLLSRKATVFTKPELEIYADDVKCAHGATVAEIDKKALYYLQSRGISRAQAQIMLNFGFINELVDQMPNEGLAEWLRPQLRERFASMASSEEFAPVSSEAGEQ